MPKFEKFTPGQRVEVDGNEAFVDLQNPETGMVRVKTPKGSMFIYHPDAVTSVSEKPAPKTTKNEPA